MRAAALLGLFLAAVPLAFDPGLSTPQYRTLRMPSARRTGPRAQLSAATIQRRARKARAVAREKRRQRRAR